MCSLAPYNLKHVRCEGWDVICNRPKQAAYRAPGSPMGAFAVESVIDELCNRLGLDPIDVRLKNASKEGTKAAFGPKFQRIGLVETLEAARDHPHYSAPLKQGQGRGVSCGFWFNHAGETAVSLALAEDGTVSLSVGTPDIGGSRASMCQMAAEALGDSIRQGPDNDRRYGDARVQRRQPWKSRYLCLRPRDDQGRGGHG